MAPLLDDDDPAPTSVARRPPRSWRPPPGIHARRGTARAQRQPNDRRRRDPLDHLALTVSDRPSAPGETDDAAPDGAASGSLLTERTAGLAGSVEVPGGRALSGCQTRMHDCVSARTRMADPGQTTEGRGVHRAALIAAACPPGSLWCGSFMASVPAGQRGEAWLKTGLRCPKQRCLSSLNTLIGRCEERGDPPAHRGLEGRDPAADPPGPARAAAPPLGIPGDRVTHARPAGRTGLHELCSTSSPPWTRPSGRFERLHQQGWSSTGHRRATRATGWRRSLTSTHRPPAQPSTRPCRSRPACGFRWRACGRVHIHRRTRLASKPHDHAIDRARTRCFIGPMGYS